MPDLQPKIMLGGLAFHDVPHLWQRLGADGFSPTARAGVRLGASLVGLT